MNSRNLLAGFILVLILRQLSECSVSIRKNHGISEMKNTSYFAFRVQVLVAQLYSRRLVGHRENKVFT